MRKVRKVINPGAKLSAADVRAILAAWNEDKDRIEPQRYKYDLHAVIGAYFLRRQERDEAYAAMREAFALIRPIEDMAGQVATVDWYHQTLYRVGCLLNDHLQAHAAAKSVTEAQP